jgi:sulfite oxidase
VDVSGDGGKTWTTANLTQGEQAGVWTFWQAQLTLGAGEHEIVARAVDTSATMQPEHTHHVWNFKGYMNNAWHRIKVKVKS